MTGPVVMVDLPKGADAAKLAAALGIDLYRARMIIAAGVPFLAHGFADRAAAEALASALTGAGLPSSAHDPAAVERIPAASEVVGFALDGKSVVFLSGDGRRAPLGPGMLRCLVQGRLTVELDQSPPAGFPLRPLGGLGQGPTSKTVVAHRLELFCEPKPGSIGRLAIRHDRFDFSALGDRKTLSAVRNVEALRELLAKVCGAAPFDDSFHRTDAARERAPDTWIDFDLDGVGRTQAVRSNRQAFDGWSRLRFLHALARRPERAEHYFEF